MTSGPLARTWALLAGEEHAPPPWWAPHEAAGRRIAAARMPHGQAVADVLDAAGPPPPWRFVHPDTATEGEAYEAFIARTRCIPTRDHPHDLFNGVVWLGHSRLKQHLNGVQAAEIARHGIGPRRGRVRDALTLFDENGAWLQAPDVLVQALEARDWHGLFITHRAHWADATLTVFGHALMEQLWLSPHKGLTAHVWIVPQHVEPLDHLLSHLTSERLSEGVKPHVPLPLAGVPGWWPGNEAPEFVEDRSVFRPFRR